MSWPINPAYAFKSPSRDTCCFEDPPWIFEAGLKPAINPKILALERPGRGGSHEIMGHLKVEVSYEQRE
jgi:hypothetical protein